MKLKPIREQVVVVFGASSGIGRETARQFAKRGAKVVVSARGEEGLDTLVEEIRRHGGQAIAVPAEAADFEQVKEVAGRAQAEYGGLDTWAHVAGVSLYATFEQTTPEEFRRVIDVNLNGPAYGALAALPLLRQRGGGAFIVVSSVEGKVALPLQSAYAASKHGVEGFLTALRAELQHEGAPISVTSVKPAGINTPLFNKARTRIGVKPIPTAPIYEPDVVARAILYAAEHPSREMLAGGAARAFIAGKTLAPALMDKVVGAVGQSLQKTDEPKGPDAPSNLYEPVRGYDRVHGDFSDKARGSLYTWWQTNPAARVAITGSAIGVLAWLALRSQRQAATEFAYNDEGAYDLSDAYEIGAPGELEEALDDRAGI